MATPQPLFFSPHMQRPKLGPPMDHRHSAVDCGSPLALQVRILVYKYHQLYYKKLCNAKEIYKYVYSMYKMGGI